MKKCPTCDKTFDDGMRFCQTDGTPLVEAADVEEADPFKTMVGGSPNIASATPPDPFKTMVAPPKKKDSPELSKESDLSETGSSASPDKYNRGALADEDEKQAGKNITPPSPFGVIKPENADEKSPFGAKSSNINEESSQDDLNYSTPESNPSGSPIPSPFEESMIDYQAPLKPTPPFDDPSPFSAENKEKFNQPPTPFEVAEVKAEALNTPYAEEVEEQQHQPIEQANWSPPPAPESSWQNQQIGENTPFQSPPAGQGQNQTLAIVSLVLGILSIPCCGFILFGIGALVTGYMARSKADQNPDEYGGRGLATGGMILGAITVAIGIIMNIVYLFIGLPMNTF